MFCLCKNCAESWSETKKIFLIWHWRQGDQIGRLCLLWQFFKYKKLLHFYSTVFLRIDYVIWG
jgi:hypothetical protein